MNAIAPTRPFPLHVCRVRLITPPPAAPAEVRSQVPRHLPGVPAKGGTGDGA